LLLISNIVASSPKVRLRPAGAQSHFGFVIGYAKVLKHQKAEEAFYAASAFC
jgi:hypothetical protein